MFPYRYRIETIADTWNEAFVAYDPTPYPGDAMLFRASTGFVLGNDVGRLNGWERLIVGNVEVNECPGDHSTMCEQPHVRVLARRLGSYLRRQVSDNKFREPDVTTSNERKQSPLLVEADRARESSTNPVAHELDGLFYEATASFIGKSPYASVRRTGPARQSTLRAPR